MKPMHAYIMLAAISVASFVFSVAHFRACRKDEPISVSHLKNAEYVADKLHLDPAQTQALRLLNERYRRRLQQGCARNCEARRRLTEAMTDENRTVYDDILMDLCKAYEETERATLEHVEAVRTLLDSDQRKTFDRLLARCLCQKCCGIQEAE